MGRDCRFFTREAARNQIWIVRKKAEAQAEREREEAARQAAEAKRKETEAIRARVRAIIGG